MGRRAKYYSQEEAQKAHQDQRLQRSLKPGAKEVRREQNARAYAKRKIFKAVQALSEAEISEYDYKHIYMHHFATEEGPLALPDFTLTDTDFRNMAGHPPYPAHIVNFPSFEKDWPIISAAFHGYAARNYMLEQKRWIDEAASCDWASLGSKLMNQYHNVMADWEQFRIEVREHGKDPTSLPTELIAFQNQLWTSRRLMWLKADLENSKEGKNMLFAAMRSRDIHF
ncbi:hypothetical protein EST38_g11193 [Candolleomyces aberdarensis]|uniref:Uncharacterized protein n=1 Tax=Candolleomyces aberdarensis TaxID=2316362 RepID=A0A4Q2D5H6_9AGAR|nr:hypothetical protein EST38_g11193 [Candolleomyces aberdarensis]